LQDKTPTRTPERAFAAPAAMPSMTPAIHANAKTLFMMSPSD
jgi:hypothetical protein